jgi:methionine-rich copper-binding protein CopC
MRRRIVVAAAAATLVPAGVAWAHAEVKSVSPRNNSTRHSAVREVHITFKSSVTTGLITIKTSSGKIVGLTANGLKPGNSAVVRAVPRTPLGNGRYTVQWRARAQDGHRESGSWGFRVAR